MHVITKQRSLLVVLVAATFVSFACAQSGSQAGRVSSVVQHATRQGKPLQQNDVLFEKDTLKTDRTGRLRVSLSDGSLLTLGGNSIMRITQHDAAARQTSIELQFGRLRSKVNALTASGSKFEVRTAAAVAGVIGTDFLVVETNDGTYVYCYEGRVSVTSVFGLGSVTLSAGQFVLVTQNSLGKPTSFQPGDEIVTEVSGGGSKLSGLQIGGIILGAVGGTLGGVIATTGSPGDANALPTPTPLPTPCLPNANFKGCPPRLTSGILTVQRSAMISAPSANLAAKQLFVPRNWMATRISPSAMSMFAKPAFRTNSMQAFLPAYRPSNSWLATRPGALGSNRFAMNWMPRILVNHPALARTPLSLQIGRTPLALNVGRTTPVVHGTPPVAAGAVHQRSGTFVPGVPGSPGRARH